MEGEVSELGSAVITTRLSSIHVEHSLLPSRATRKDTECQVVELGGRVNQ